jgi:hypothetical protein
MPVDYKDVLGMPPSSGNVKVMASRMRHIWQTGSREGKVQQLGYNGVGAFRKRDLAFTGPGLETASMLGALTLTPYNPSILPSKTSIASTATYPLPSSI